MPNYCEIEWDEYGRPAFLVTDRDGKEKMIAAKDLGPGWEAK